MGKCDYSALGVKHSFSVLSGIRDFLVSVGKCDFSVLAENIVSRFWRKIYFLGFDGNHSLSFLTGKCDFMSFSGKIKFYGFGNQNFIILLKN